MSVDWLTVLKSRNTRLDLMMRGWRGWLCPPLTTRGEQNVVTSLSPLGWLGSWILRRTAELQFAPLE